MRLMRETWAMAGFAYVDLLGTLWLMNHHVAREMNPLLVYFLQRSVMAFVLAKVLYTLIPLAAVETLGRRVRPLAQRCLRLSLVLFIAIQTSNLLCFLVALKLRT